MEATPMKEQIVALRVRYDPDDHDPPFRWTWSLDPEIQIEVIASGRIEEVEE
jgi:hypothetical protein